MTEEELAELRVYKPAEVARMLHIPITRLERWVRENRVPHLRAGVSRGVEFQTEHIRRISQMLPELQAGRRCGRPAGTPDGQQTGPGPADAVPSVEQVAGWARLRAHRPTPRSPRSAR
jgi:hypothetical protein